DLAEGRRRQRRKPTCPRRIGPLAHGLCDRSAGLPRGIGSGQNALWHFEQAARKRTLADRRAAGFRSRALRARARLWSRIPTARSRHSWGVLPAFIFVGTRR